MPKDDKMILSVDTINDIALRIINLLYDKSLTIKTETWHGDDYSRETKLEQRFRTSGDFPVEVRPNRLGPEGNSFLTFRLTDISVHLSDGTVIVFDKKTITITDEYVEKKKKRKFLQVISF